MRSGAAAGAPPSADSTPTGWTPALEQRLIAAARAAAPFEACGLLVRDAQGRFAVPQATNVADDRRTGFELDPACVLRWTSDPSADVLGSWHSHPEGPLWPSRADLAGASLGSWLAIVGRGPDRRWRVAFTRVPAAGRQSASAAR
ncbi:MAG: Mov34/MPN/PAD-1 family protein [Planctomycetota bacterium]